MTLDWLEVGATRRGMTGPGRSLWSRESSSRTPTHRPAVSFHLTLTLIIIIIVIITLDAGKTQSSQRRASWSLASLAM